MSKINVLSFEIANLIAAGEVVERPSSVLKELLENSIDSGATKIVAEIKRGGVALIRVSDNGCGIEKEDLPIALKRHATSKIREKDDLSKIMTLGFRGEALAAISSVSVMTLISKPKNAEMASMLTAEGGNIVDMSEVGAADGTTVVVENLFYNVPARRKFLKKDATEAMNVSALVEKVALSRPDISIQLLIDGVERFKTPGNSDLLDTIYSIFGKEFSSKLIKADGEANGIKVHGYIGRSDNVKKNRNLQNVFINGRYVKSLTAMAAIEKAYTSYIAPECFPVCILFLEMHPGTVDVNVHPAKLEVKFSDERIVFESVYYTVKSALESYEYRPEMILGSKKKDYNPLGAFVPIGQDTKGEQISIRESLIEKRPEVKYSSLNEQNPKSELNYDKPVRFSSPAASSVKTEIKASPSMSPKSSIELLERYKNVHSELESAEAVEKSVTPDAKSEASMTLHDYKYIGEAFNCYVMIEYDGAILMIDKHAAHERILFEELKKRREMDGRIASQSLLLPICVILSAEELSCAIEYKSELESVGFEYKINGKSADISVIPEALSASDAESLFIEILDEIGDGLGNAENTVAIKREKTLYQIACKAAIKGGRVYDKALITWLIEKLLDLPDITVCPHGRPVAYRITKSELDRQFERIK